MPRTGNIADLVWLSPSADSLVALSKQNADAAWERLRLDPGCVLLLLRHTGKRFSFAELVAEPSLLLSAADYLGKPGFACADRSGPAFVHQVCRKQAQLAEFLATRVGHCDPQRAWIGGLLAPLGWLALSAADADKVDILVRAGNFRSFDSAACARRLNHSWHLPNWLSVLTGSLDLPVDIASRFGCDSTLLMVVQLATALIERRGGGLGLAIGEPVAELMRRLNLSVQVVEEGFATLGDHSEITLASPDSVPLLADMLRIAADNRTFAAKSALLRCHEEIDSLHAALQEQAAGRDRRLLEQKIRAMAELSAGAGHEINNPLAVISGQAQYLLAREEEPARCKSLQVIVEQAQRIHQLLVDLMHFARPPAPHKTTMPVSSVIRDILLSLQGLATDKKIAFTCADAPAGLSVWADPGQTQIALKNLLRNAIEAAPAGGWARLSVEVAADAVRFIVEDSGPGLTAAAREHMFDPFYSGRSAGRGRGLGLPTAWQFARQNDGDIRLEDVAPTRFVLELPAAEIKEPPANGHNGNGAQVTQLIGEGRLSWD